MSSARSHRRQQLRETVVMDVIPSMQNIRRVSARQRKHRRRKSEEQHMTPPNLILTRDHIHPCARTVVPDAQKPMGTRVLLRLDPSTERVKSIIDEWQTFAFEGMPLNPVLTDNHLARSINKDDDLPPDTKTRFRILYTLEKVKWSAPSIVQRKPDKIDWL